MLGMRGPAQQIYAPADGSQGEPSQDWISQRLQWIGQLNPFYQGRHAMWHGRPLAGMGSFAPPTESTGRGEVTHGTFLKELEGEDDVYGSGIFDQSGRGPTVHATLGVFEDHPSLPGYVGREVQFAVSKEVSDITSGADVVVVPGGGMSYQERGGKIVQYDRFGPTPPRPDYNPPAGPGAYTEKNQVYTWLDDNILQSRIARLKDTERAPEPGHIGLRASTVAEMQRKAGNPAAAKATLDMAERQLGHTRRPVVPYDRSVRVMPTKGPRDAGAVPTTHFVPNTGAVGEYFEPPMSGVGEYFEPPGMSGYGAYEAQGPQPPRRPPYGVRKESIVDAPLWAVGIHKGPPGGFPVRVSPAPVPVHRGWPKSYGAAEEEPKPLGWGAYAIGGLLVGAAAAMLVGATKMKGGKAR